MEYDVSLIALLLLMLSGLIAGFINTLAGGGSLLTLPALMLMGLPADIANATNRVGVFLSAVEGARGFNRHGKLDKTAIVPILVPTVMGSLIGSLLASYLPTSLLEPVLLSTLVVMGVVIVVRPTIVAPPPGTIPLRVNESTKGFIGLLLAGVYGGFVQAGVGFVLIAALCGALRYDLVRANALKMLATGIFSLVALIVFIARDQVLWVPGLVLAVGTVVGVRLSVRFAISVDQKVLRWILLAMVITVCLAAWLK